MNVVLISKRGRSRSVSNIQRNNKQKRYLSFNQLIMFAFAMATHRIYKHYAIKVIS